MLTGALHVLLPFSFAAVQPGTPIHGFINNRIFDLNLVTRVLVPFLQEEYSEIDDIPKNCRAMIIRESPLEVAHDYYDHCWSHCDEITLGLLQRPDFASKAYAMFLQGQNSRLHTVAKRVIRKRRDLIPDETMAFLRTKWPSFGGGAKRAGEKIESRINRHRHAITHHERQIKFLIAKVSKTE